MNFQKFEKIDRKILSSAVSLLVLSLFLLWQDAWIYTLVQSIPPDQEQIGEVKIMQNDVRRRFEVALSWLPISQQTEIYQGDSIFTGNNSNVVIETKSGEQITIAPNSLVVINKRKGSISLNISFGSIQSKIDKGKTLLITSNNTMTELSGNNTAIKIDAGEGSNLAFNVLSGEAKIKSNSKEKVLRVDDTYMLNGRGDVIEPTRSTIQLVSPLAEQKFKIRDDQPVIFKWQTARQYSRMKIKIAADPEFKKIIQDARVDGNSFSGYSLPRDTFLYWQILAEGGVSQTQSFGLVGERAPIPIYPKPGYHFFYDPVQFTERPGSLVSVSWAQGSLASHYEVQLATESTFKKIIQTHKTRDLAQSLGLLAKGVYFWRVRAIDFTDQPWSAASIFKVGPEPSQTLASPLPLLANNTFFLRTKPHNHAVQNMRSANKKQIRSLIESYPVITWSLVEGAQHYMLQISKNRNFSKLLVDKKLRKNYFSWNDTELGTFYWRVRALSKNYKTGSFSPTQTLTIALDPPISLTQTLIIDEVPEATLLKAPPPPLKLKWNPTIYTDSYEVEFSESSDFKNPYRFISEGSERTVTVDKPGIFYWRIRGLNRFQEPLSPFSATNTLEFQRIYKDPSLAGHLIALYPKQQDSIILVGKDASELEFKWSKPYPDTRYRLELSHDPDFQVVFFSTETENNYFKYRDIFKEKIVYWRVRAESKNFTTDWTGGNRFLISQESTPFSIEQSDLMFDARLKAKERQKEMFAAQKRRILQLRTPASKLELQLDTPQLVSPPNEFVIESNLNQSLSPQTLAKQDFSNFFSQVRNHPTFKWNKVPAAERYIFEIARDRQFTKVISKTPCWDPFYTWDTIRPGQFYYRVQAFNDRYTRSHHSPVQSLQVTTTAPIITSADNFVEVFSEPRDMWPPPSPFSLSWSPVVFARNYEVEFSENREFNIAKVFKMQNTKSEFRVSKSGLYYWRVRALNENNIAISAFSDIRSVEIIQTNRTPASTGNLTGLFPTDRTLLFVGKGLMNLPFIWSASTAPVKLEISDSDNFEKILAQAETKSGKTLINSNLPQGKIFWRIRSHNTVSPTYEFYLRREYQAQKASAPATVHF